MYLVQNATYTYEFQQHRRKTLSYLSICFETAGWNGLTEQQAVSKQMGMGGGSFFPQKNQLRSCNEEEYRGKVFLKKAPMNPPKICELVFGLCPINESVVKSANIVRRKDEQPLKNTPPKKKYYFDKFSKKVKYGRNFFPKFYAVLCKELPHLYVSKTKKK